MKKIVVCFLFLFSFSISLAQGFEVKKFTVEIIVNKDGWFDVTEKYDINFTEYKHGLFRNIITKYKLDDETRKIYIEDIQVPGENFSVTPKFLEKINGEIEIKIGDKDKTIIGPKHYEIKYRVKNAILFQGDKAMLYWNLKPDGWLAVFDKIEFYIMTPEGAKLSADNSFTYSGLYGDNSPSTKFDFNYSNNSYTATSKENSLFLPNENVTVLVKMPRSLVTEVDYSPSAFIQYGWMGILGAFLVYFWSVWNRFGKDTKVIPVTSYYPPKGIDPAMAGFLINDRDDASDLISLLPKWGQEGIIRMEEIPKKGLFGKSDTKIIKLKDLPNNCPDYEQTIFRGLFSKIPTTSQSINDLLNSVQSAITGEKTNEDTDKGETGLDSVLISSLKETFFTTMNTAKTQLKASAQVYYDSQSNRIMDKSIGLSALGIFLVSGIFLFVFGLVPAVISAVFFIFLAIMSGYMKKKNNEGDRILGELKGFRQFIKLAETNRIKTLIESDPNYFEKTMSYALTFGLLKEWASKFAALNIPPPQWYNSSSNSGIAGMNSFANSFSSSMASTQSAMVSTPQSSSSGGGGSSGGGFGGGGGGSW